MNKDHAYDEKLNRSLASHTLDSLVFEKRVRKSVWNPLPIVPQKEKKTPKRLIKGKPIKKIQKRVRKEPSPSVDSEDDS